MRVSRLLCVIGMLLVALNAFDQLRVWFYAWLLPVMRKSSDLCVVAVIYARV